MFEDSDILKWEKPEPGVVNNPALGLHNVPYENPPKFFTLRGVRYAFMNMECFCQGGSEDGKRRYLAKRVDDPEQLYVWVSEHDPEEMVRVLVPRSKLPQLEGISVEFGL